TQSPTVAVASGSCALQIPSTTPSGTYELRLFPNGMRNLLATSNTFTVTTGTGGGAWVKCANENQICTVPGTKNVRFGANGSYVTKVVTNSIPCTLDAFGSDPAYGVVKVCEYDSGTTPAPPNAAPNPVTGITVR